MASLGKAQLDKFTEQLSTLRDNLLAQYDSNRHAADTVVLDQSKVGRLSRMDAMQHQQMAQSTQRSIAGRLKLVHAALAKVTSGDYGYCDECGDEISPERLSVQPEAPCCFACQSQQEYHPQS